MKARKVALVVMMSLLAANVIVSVSPRVFRTAYADDTWYVGEGAKQDMYVSYQIQDFDTNNGRPYTMTVYLEKQDSDGDWIAPSYVVDQGRVVNGTLNLSSLDMSVLGKGSQIPKEMTPYVNGYKNSLDWLSAYVTKSDPQSLSAASWGKIASIGGSEIKPAGTEKVTVKGGAFDATRIVYHKSVDNVIWVVNDFPWPVKALTYADVTTGNPPIQYSYELLATGSGRPPAQESLVELPKPPLEETTATGDFFIGLNWSPAELRPGTNATFDVSFFDNAHNPVQSVSYNMKLVDSNGSALVDLKNQFAEDSMGRHEVSLKPENMGPVKLTVEINSVGSQNPSSFIESADFNIVVVPEFPVVGGSIFALVVIFALVILLSRPTTHRLPGLR